MLRYDPDIQRLFASSSSDTPQPTAILDVADWRSSREFFNDGIAAGERNHPRADHIPRLSLVYTTSDGDARELRWYRPDEASSSVILYFHGGGMYHGNLDLYDGIAARLADRSGVPVLAVDYRIAPEHPHPVPVRDCYEALLWLAENATHLGFDPARIILMGDSAGGGLAAGTALMSRDLGGPIPALQVLIYPMLDDRTDRTPEALAPLATWNHEHNLTAWRTLLGDAAGGTEVSPYAAPARAQNLVGLPDVYMETGQLDLFAAEILLFASRLADAGVQLEFHVRPGMPHGFDFAAPDAAMTMQAVADRVRAIQSV
ncbi:alpha/beta hydrolase [Microbacterium murale]|uniref:Alpha/beta hydrolase n=1 Tax=Microbacterium murale TaxID=1081040 RepID=A0ABQ1RJ98_9MICO|nr:alpha/beta hydrolase [Microbacterium murale]GGD70101.1 alpha/beta hydrolase [Microbacterium murale]